MTTDSRARDTTDTPRRVSSNEVTFLLAVLVVCLGAANGGFFQSTWNWCLLIGAVVVLVAVATRDLVQLDVQEWLAVGLLVAVAMWTLVAGAWADDPVASRVEANRLLLYVSFLGVALLASRFAGSLVWGATIGICVISSYALTAYLVVGTASRPSAFEGYLLFRPVGYANALGALAALGLVATLGLAVESPRRSAALACAAMWVPLTATLVLTQSRGAWLAFLVGVAATVVVLGRRAIPAVLIAAPCIATTAAVSWSAHHARLDRSFDLGRARVLALTLVVLSLASCFAWRHLRGRHLRVTPGWVAIAPLCLLIVAGLLVTRHADANALESLGVRRDYWRVAWPLFTEHTFGGSGPGAFATAWQRQGDGSGALNAHNLYLETLAETGLVGLVLLGGFLAVPLMRIRSVLRRRYVPTALGAYIVFLAHAFVDWDWQVPVVTVSGLAFGAALLVASRDTAPSLGTSGRRLVMLASLAVLAIAVGELASRH